MRERQQKFVTLEILERERRILEEILSLRDHADPAIVEGAAARLEQIDSQIEKLRDEI